jgi:glycosyltransferase involved in cell wall biosynthesis
MVDDCSTDNYDDILSKFSDIINIKYIRKDTNDGSGITRNIGIDNADGDYIVFADGDDTFLNAFSIEKMVKDIESDNYDLLLMVLFKNKKIYSFHLVRLMLHGYGVKYIEQILLTNGI